MDTLAPEHVEAVGAHVRLGKQTARKDKRTLQLSRYLIDPATGKKLTVAKLPNLKSSVKQSQLIQPGGWGVMGNNAYGNCTCAAAGHAEQIASAVVSNGKLVHTPSDDEIMAAYWATGVPPTPGADDNGRVELDVLGYWRAHGIGGSRISAYASIKTTPVASFEKMTKYAIDLFGFAYIGLSLPRSAQTQKVWTVSRGPNSAAGSWGGHAVILVDYDSKGPTCVTWGQLVRLTWGFFHRYCDEAYVAITPEWLGQTGQVNPATGVTPDGINVTALMDDLHSITA